MLENVTSKPPQTGSEDHCPSSCVIIFHLSMTPEQHIFYIQHKNAVSPDITQTANASEPQCYYENYWGQKNSRGGLPLHRARANAAFQTTFLICCSLTGMLPAIADSRLFSLKIEKRPDCFVSLSALLYIVSSSVATMHLAAYK